MAFQTNLYNYEDKNKELKLILGALIKYKRIEENMSLNFVADVIKINKGYLSEVENGKRFLAEKHIKNIFEFLGSPFIDDEKILYSLRKTLDDIFYLSIDYEFEKIETIFLKIFEKREIYENSYGFFIFNLIWLIYEILIHHDETTIKNLESFFSGYSNVLKNNEKLYLYLFLSNHYVQSDNFDQGDFYIKKGYELSKIANNNLITALLKHIEASNLCYFGYGNKAYIYATESLNYFKNTFYFNRILFINNIIGLSLIGMRLFDLAETHYLNLLEHVSDDKKDIVQTILNNLSWCSLLSKNYDKSLYYADKALESGSDFEELFVNKAYSYFKLKEYDSCCQIVDSFIVKDRNSYFKDFLSLLKSRINRKDDEFLNTVFHVLELAKEKKNIEIEKMILELIIDFYEEKNNFKQSNAYLKKLINLLEE